MAVAPPRHSSPPIGGAVDLSKRARNSICDDSSSSSGSSITDVKPAILPALLQQHVDTVIAAPIPTVVTPPFTSMFKKSPSMTRPFKAYPKDPLNLPLGLVGGVTPAETMLNAASNEAYAEFRRQMLAQVSAAKTRRAGSPTSSLTKDEGSMEQQQQQRQPTQPEELGSPQQPSSSATDPSVGSRDPAYWERRRKNNEAAKRSRDARRAKEDEIAIRAAFLEQENLKLKYEVAALRNETSRLRCMLYSSS
ncbi:hypothetical protein B566_EDAN010187 [Ephemera danica]|nr:hypothetical protein B566_EDAN010187 [Ephemera danica]